MLLIMQLHAYIRIYLLPLNIILRMYSFTLFLLTTARMRSPAMSSNPTVEPTEIPMV